MGQIIQLPALPPDYPETIEALDPAERAFLLAVRCWVAARQQGEDPLFRMHAALRSVGAATAASPLDRFLKLAARSAARRIVTYCTCTPELGEDEKQLLHSASLVQNGESELASQVLRAAMLSTQGAVLALDPLEEMGEQFARSKLLFPRRKLPAVETAFPASVESWLSSLSGTTLH